MVEMPHDTIAIFNLQAFAAEKTSRVAGVSGGRGKEIARCRLRWQ